MRVLALTRYGRLGASSRMRIYQYVPALKELGVDVEISPLLSDSYLKRKYTKQSTSWSGVFRDYLRQTFRLLSTRRFDLLWIEKEIFPNLPAWFEQALRMLGVDYVVDYDDAVFHADLLNRHPAKRLLRGKIESVMRNAKMVVCGNAYLADYASSAGARRVAIVPTVIDLDRYTVLPHVARDYFVIGWIGSPSTVRYLEVVMPALTRLAARHPIRLRVIGAQFEVPGVNVECRTWSEESEVKEICDFDIGIMPLIDSPWERGKCGYKLIQYMACGKAVVASAIGVNPEIVEEGRSGYLATTVEEWIAALEALISDAARRQAMGAQGRLSVEQRYCLQVAAPRTAKLFTEMTVSP